MELCDDVNSSPELLSHQPLADQYASDDSPTPDPVNKKKPKLSSSGRSSTKNDVTLSSLKKYFNVEYCSKPTFSAKEIDNLDIPQIVQHLNHFVTNKNDVTGNQIVQKVLDISRRNDHLKCIYNVKNFHLNFKEIDSFPDVLDDCTNSDLSTVEGQVVDFMTSLVEVLARLDNQHNAYNSSNKDQVVKMCVHRYCGLLGEPIQYGRSEYTLQASVSSLGQTEKVTRTFVCFTDLVVTGGATNTPGIPVQVYNPCEKTQSRPCNPSLCDCIPNSNPDANSQGTMDETEQDIFKSVSENIPVHKGPTSDILCQNHFKYQLATEHVLQTIAVAAKGVFNKCFKTGLDHHKKRVFLGLCVVKEYVYITKIMSTEMCLAKFGTVFEIPEDSSQKLGYLNKIYKPVNNINVEFLPTVFDTSCHNQRVALLMYLKYFKYNWDNFEIN